MAPNGALATSGAGVVEPNKKALDLNALRKCIPQEAFSKSILRSTFYLIFDYAMWAGACYAIYTLRTNEAFGYKELPVWQQWAASIAYWNVAGFFMWCIFVVGHDCGHSTFSNYWLVNDIIGHVTHGSIMVPYYPWQLSHSRHHAFHNHISKDYSHPWYTPDKLEKPDEELARLMDRNPWVRFFFPFFGWLIYLYGMPDGSHFIPFKSQRMWAESDPVEYTKCIISSLVVVANIAGIFLFWGQNVHDFCYYYVAPAIVYGWWLVAVTYLQHHNPDTLVYDEHDWKFVDSAFETVDRKFGFGIDTLHHHITDGHVAHHLFYKAIPHYNLPIATKAIREYMINNGLGHM